MHWYSFEICLGDGSMASDQVPGKSEAEAEATVLRIYPGARWAKLQGTRFSNVANKTGAPSSAPPPPSRPPAGPDPYTVLGVAREADQQAIKDAWKKGLRSYHPDRVADLGPELIAVAERKTRELNAAYDQLRHRG